MEPAGTGEPVVVLIEDDPSDIDSFLRVAARMRPALTVHVARTLDEGAMLIQAVRDSEDLRLVVLDFSFSDQNSLGMLGKVRSPSDLLRVPVVIFTGRASEEEMEIAERIGANSVIRKPLDHAEFQIQVESMLRYWLSQNLVPIKGK